MTTTDSQIIFDGNDVQAPAPEPEPEPVEVEVYNHPSRPFYTEGTSIAVIRTNTQYLLPIVEARMKTLHDIAEHDKGLRGAAELATLVMDVVIFSGPDFDMHEACRIIDADVKGEDITEDHVPVSGNDHFAVNATPAAEAHAEEHGVDLADVEGTGADGKVTKPDVEAYVNA